MFVKPAGTGSSVGISKARDREGLLAALKLAAGYDRKILIEEFIDGREVEVAVLGNDNPFASVCGEIDSGAEFYDYEAKYISDSANLYIPARISDDTSERVRDAAIRVYEAMGCRGLSRVDFFVTHKDQEVVFNEINTIPGFTSISMRRSSLCVLAYSMRSMPCTAASMAWRIERAPASLPSGWPCTAPPAARITSVPHASTTFLTISCVVPPETAYIIGLMFHHGCVKNLKLRANILYGIGNFPQGWPLIWKSPPARRVSLPMTSGAEMPV